MDFKIDMQAVAKVASRVQLLSVKLADLTAKRGADIVGKRLTANIDRKCIAARYDAERIDVRCHYVLHAMASDVELASVTLTYDLSYSVDTGDPISESDAEHFAHANGAYNSWPFARELFHSMTYRMGFPPFTLPVLTFAPPRPKAKLALKAHGHSEGKAAKS